MKTILFMLVAFSQVVFAGQIGGFNMSRTDGLDLVLYSEKDPNVQGIVCHVATTKAFAQTKDPSQSSVSCNQVGPIVIKDVNKNNKAGEDAMVIADKAVFGTSKLKLRRFYDASTDSLVYITYVEKAIGGSVNVAVSSVPLKGQAQWTYGSAASAIPGGVTK